MTAYDDLSQFQKARLAIGGATNWQPMLDILAGAGLGGTEGGDPYAGESSFQKIGADLELAASAGKNVADGTAYLAPIMGNLLGDALTKTGNYLGGVIGAYSVTGTKATHYPAGAVLGQITDGVTACDGAFVAFIDGDSATTIAGAAFKVRCNNSTAASGFNFGVDLQDAAHDGFQPVDSAFYLSAPVRIVDDVCLKVGSATPTDGGSGTGVGVMGPGSLYFCTGTPGAYVNTGSKASPSWKAITHA